MTFAICSLKPILYEAMNGKIDCMSVQQCYRPILSGD